MHQLLLITLSLLFSMNLYANTQLPSPKAEDLQPINKIIAVVNKEIITQAELDHALRTAKKQFQQRGLTIPHQKKFRTKVLDGLIYQKLQLQMAKQNNITVTEKQVNAAITNIAQQNQLSVPQFKQKLAEQHVDLKTFKKQLKEQLMVSTLQHEALNGKVEITDAKVAEFKKQYNKENSLTEYNLHDYLIPLPENAQNTEKQAAERQALALVKQLNSSNKVQDKGVEVNPLGWRSLNDLPDLFATTVVNLRSNQVSKPLLAGNGYHVLKLMGTRDKAATISDEQARELLAQQETQKVLQKWLEQIRRNAYVKIYD